MSAPLPLVSSTIPSFYRSLSISADFTPTRISERNAMTLSLPSHMNSRMSTRQRSGILVFKLLLKSATTGVTPSWNVFTSWPSLCTYSYHLFWTTSILPWPSTYLWKCSRIQFVVPSIVTNVVFSRMFANEEGRIPPGKFFEFRAVSMGLFIGIFILFWTPLIIWKILVSKIFYFVIFVVT